MLRRNTKAVGGIAHSVALGDETSVSQLPETVDGSRGPPDTHKDADINRLGDPVVRHGLTNKKLDAVDILGGCASLVVDVAGQSCLVERVANHHNSLDSIESVSSEGSESIGGCCGALRVSLQDDAAVRLARDN